MTKQGDLKKLIRARMLKTGESYTTARRMLLAMRPDANPAEVPEGGQAEAVGQTAPKGVARGNLVIEQNENDQIVDLVQWFKLRRYLSRRDPFTGEDIPFDMNACGVYGLLAEINKSLWGLVKTKKLRPPFIKFMLSWFSPGGRARLRRDRPRRERPHGLLLGGAVRCGP